MNDRWREVVDPQTALIQAEGELRPKARSQPQNIPAMPARSESQSTNEDIQSLSRPSMREARHASGSPKNIQSP
jgi:hypothetical protein